MKKEKLNWHIVNKNYIKYLKQYDDKVQNIEYKNTYKPYVGIVLKINKFKYYVPISSVKSKHYDMNENKDFIKIMTDKNILLVINLNNMIPILDNEIILLKFKDISKYFKFKNKESERKYIALINREIKIINRRKEEITSRARQLYELKINKPKTKISQRCCDFCLLEEKCIEYSKKRYPF